MTCAMCRSRVNDSNGGNPKCSFPNDGEFTSDGWNCATANAIRDLTSQDDPNDRADYRFCDAQNYSTIKVDEIALPSGYALALWVSWYKRRGRTEAMWLLGENDAPRLPTGADCAAIVAALRVTELSLA